MYPAALLAFGVTVKLWPNFTLSKRFNHYGCKLISGERKISCVNGRLQI